MYVILQLLYDILPLAHASDAHLPESIGQRPACFKTSAKTVSPALCL